MGKTTEAKALQGPTVDPQVVDAAKDHVFRTKPVRTFPCRVCGTPGGTDRSDRLCWVCRRLKLSAWSDSDTQDSLDD